MFGPYVIAPTIAATGSVLMHMSPYRRGRVAVVVLNCAAIAGPALLQVTGVLPASYLFTGDAIVIQPGMLSFPAVPTQIFMLVNTLATIVVASALIAQIRNTLTRVEEQMYVHTWQLRQLVPDHARPASARHIDESVAQLPDAGPLSE
jgi:serine/threonine-protein kinase